MPSSTHVHVRVTRDTRADLRKEGASEESDVQGVSKDDVIYVHPDVASNLVDAEAAVYLNDEEIAALKDADPVAEKGRRKKNQKPSGNS